MGCPFDAKVIFGIELTKQRANEIADKIDEIEKNFPKGGNWQKDVGDFECEIRSDENESKFFLELSSITSASNCTVLREFSEARINSSKKEAHRIYDTSPFLKENFKIEDVKLFLVSMYVG
jgi:hypothetical protein